MMARQRGFGKRQNKVKSSKLHSFLKSGRSEGLPKIKNAGRTSGPAFEPSLIRSTLGRLGAVYARPN
jgi:hypothetical protein